MNFVAVDLGASNTRYISDSGKVGIMPNNMVIFDDMTPVDLEEYEDSLVNSLEVIIEKEGTSKFFPAHALIGNMATRYQSTNVRPSVMTNKHVQQINYISGIAAAAISRLTYGTEKDINLYVALPPIEVKTASHKNIVKQEFTGKYKVTFPKVRGGIVVELNIEDVHCYEESFMAVLSYFFNPNGTPKEEAKKFMTGQVLSLDIGASTTDLSIIKDGRYLEKSGQTYKVGGNFARDVLIREVLANYDFELPEEDADITMAEGRLQTGNTYVEIPDIVAKAKSEFAERVVSQMQGYFKSVNIPIQMVKAIIVSGGGSMQSQYIGESGEIRITSEPMSKYITDKLREVCPTVEVEPYKENPRLANIIGLFIRAMFDSKRKNNNNNTNAVEEKKEEVKEEKPAEIVEEKAEKEEKVEKVDFNIL